MVDTRLQRIEWAYKGRACVIEGDVCGQRFIASIDGIPFGSDLSFKTLSWDVEKSINVEVNRKRYRDFLDGRKGQPKPWLGYQP